MIVFISSSSSLWTTPWKASNSKRTTTTTRRTSRTTRTSPDDKNVALFEPLYSFYTEIFLAVQLNFLCVGAKFLGLASDAARLPGRGWATR